MAKLEKKYEGDIVVHGSPRLAQTPIDRDLVDASHLHVNPIIVCSGKRLFADTTTPSRLRLRLAEERSVCDGVHILIYEEVA